MNKKINNEYKATGLIVLTFHIQILPEYIYNAYHKLKVTNVHSKLNEMTKV